MGVTWIDALIMKWDMKLFNNAADSLGELVLRKSPSVDFKKAAAAVTELPLLGMHYGSKHVVRSAYVLRTLISKQTMLAITDQDWKNSRDMNKETTTKGFDALSVEDLDDADRMRFTVAEIMAAHSHSRKPTTHGRSLQLCMSEIFEGMFLTSIVEAIGDFRAILRRILRKRRRSLFADTTGCYFSEQR